MTDNEEDPDLDDAPDPDAADWSDEPADVTCPYCKREIPEEAERCPHCGNFISAEDAPRRPRSWWWIVVVVLVALLALRFIVRW